jgi:hypothetical protein
MQQEIIGLAYLKNNLKRSEMKKETFEEAAEIKFNVFQKENPIVPKNHIQPFKLGFINGAKWQQEPEQFFSDDRVKTLEKSIEYLLKRQERMYSEEEVNQMLFDLGDILFNNCQNGIKEEELKEYTDLIIKQFKKK